MTMEVDVRLTMLALVLVTGAAFADDCNFGACGDTTPEDAFRRQGNHARAVRALQDAYNAADSNDNDQFNGVKQRLDSDDSGDNSLHRIRKDADNVVDDISGSGASATQVAGIKAAFDAAKARFTEGTTYFAGKKAILEGLDLTGVASTNTEKLDAMTRALNAFIEKWNTGAGKMDEAKARVTEGRSKDDCRGDVDILEEDMINALKDLRDDLNDTINPVEDALENALESQSNFECECGMRALEFRIQQLEANNAALAANQQTIVDALNAAGIPVPTLVPMASLDDPDGTAGSPPAGSAPPSSPPPSAPPGGGEGPTGTALTAEQARGGLGAIAFANCAQMGYDCSAAAIYGPGGMVEVLARHITNRAVNDPNVIHEGDLIDFAAVDAANN